MTEQLLCWRCGKGLDTLSLPLSRLDECPDCLIHLHACRMCKYFDPLVAKACREDDAEEVKEKERANFCDYFKPSAQAFNPAVAKADSRARSELENLFDGDGAESKDNPSNQSAEDLFK